MSRKVTRTSAAINDLISHATYLGEKSPGLDERFLDAVEQGFALLAQMPELGGAYEVLDPRLQGIRVWSVKEFESYLVFYFARAAEVQIVRVLHGARDITAIL